MKATLLFFIVVALVSCTDDGPTLDENEVPFETIVKVRQGEFAEIDNPHVSLQCETEEWYPCTMYGMQSEESFDGKKITITFTKIIKPDICLDMGSPARRYYALDSLANGVYDIEINNKDRKNSGKLTIADDVLILDIPEQVGIEVPSKVVRRVPKDFYFGVVRYNHESSLDSVKQFLDKVKNIEGVINLNHQVPGVYTNFVIDENGELVVKADNWGTFFATGMIFQYEGTDPDKLLADIRALEALYKGVLDTNLH